MCAFRGKHGFGLTKSLMRRAHRGGFVPQSPTKPSPLRCTDPAVQVMRSWCVRKVFLAETPNISGIALFPWGANRLLASEPSAGSEPSARIKS